MSSPKDDAKQSQSHTSSTPKMPWAASPYIHRELRAELSLRENDLLLSHNDYM